MRLPPAILSLLLLPALAGCIGGETPAGESAQTGNDTAAQAGTQTTASATLAEADDAAAPNGTRAEVTTPLAFEGLIATGACVPSGPGSCMAPVGFPGDSVYVIEAPGRVLAVNAVVSWSATSPLTDNLWAVLVLARSCGDGCIEGDRVLEAEGASPLTLDLTGTAPPAEDEFYVIFVRQTSLAPGPLYAFASLDQPFAIEGEARSTV